MTNSNIPDSGATNKPMKERQTIKTINAGVRRTFKVLLITAATILTASLSEAQDSIVAIVRVSSGGGLVNSANTVSGVVSANSNGVGDYTVTVTSPGAFTGANSSEFAIEVTISQTSSGDETIKAGVQSLNDDSLEINVHVDEVEDETDPNTGEPRNANFYFAIYRIPTTPTYSNTSRYILANAVVNSDGTKAGGTGVGGIEVTSFRDGEGDYDITLSKAGSFIDDISNDYILALTVEGADDQDQVIRGSVQSLGSDDEVIINVHTDDVQDSGADNVTTPTDNKFFLTVYRIPSGTDTGLSASNLLVALARVSSAGSLLSQPNTPDGSILSAEQQNPGDYRLTINSPGAFAGKTADDYIPQAYLYRTSAADEAINSEVVIADADTLYIDVNANDLETDGEAQGIPNNEAFSVVLLDAVGTLRPDLRTGTKRSLSKMKGNNKYNASGNGQQVRLSLRGTEKKKFYFALENDGNIVDAISLRETGTGSKLKTRYFRLTGGRQNVTGKITKAGLTEDRVVPDRIIRFEAQARYKRPDRRPTKKIRVKARSLFNPSRRDTNRVKTVGG